MHEVVIIGTGIAGCTAAIYAARKQMDYVVIAKDFGGQFLESGEILNYPGIVKTTGEEFLSAFEKQLESNKIDPRLNEEVTQIKKVEKGFQVVTSKSQYETKTIVVATGSHPKQLNVPGEKEYKNKGVTYCSICDGPLFSGKDIAIVGGGNSALEGVDFTKDIAKKISLLNIGKQLTAHEVIIEKVRSYENVEIINEAKTTELLGDKFIQGLKYEKDGQSYTIDVEGVFIEIGRAPNTEFLRGFLILDEKGHIVIDCQARTSVEGIFAAGDCASGQEYQYAIAAGQGCIALLKAARYIANLK
ncbi:MAG: NAD(P)/FAD-dependent oxidoreductase [Nitrospirota bacterium]